MSERERFEEYFSFRQELQSTLTAEELQRLNEAVERAAQDPDFYRSLRKDPQEVLEREYGLSQSAFSKLVAAMGDMPPKRVTGSVAYPPVDEFYFSLNQELRSEFTPEELQTLDQIVDRALQDPEFEAKMREDPYTVLAEQYSIDREFLHRLSKVIDYASAPRLFGFLREFKR